MTGTFIMPEVATTNRITWLARMLGWLLHSLTDIKGPSAWQENISHTITPPSPVWTVDTWQIPVADTKFRLTICRYRDSLFSSSRPVLINLCMTLDSCSWLTGVEPAVVFCCLSPRFHMHSEMFYSANLIIWVAVASLSSHQTTFWPQFCVRDC